MEKNIKNKFIRNSEIESFLLGSKYISFNKNSYQFEVKSIESDNVVSEIKILSRLLRYSSNCSRYHANINLENAKFTYYDRCLLKYLEDYINDKDNFNHFNTCWIKKAEKNLYLNRINIENVDLNTITKENVISYLKKQKLNKKIKYVLDNEDVRETIELTKSGWILAKGDHSLMNSKKIKIKRIIKRLFHFLKVRETRDRVVDIYYSIIKNGWDKNFAWIPNGAVIGITEDTNEYFSFTGRHRVVAAAVAQRKFKNEINNIFLPVIRVPNKLIIGKEAYPGDGECVFCYRGKLND